MKYFIPNLKRVAFVRSNYQSNSKFQKDEFQDFFDDYGIELIDISEASADSAMSNLIFNKGNFDAIYTSCDGLIQGQLEKDIAAFALGNKLPLFSCNKSAVKKGALAAVTVNFHEIGKSAGIKAAKLLENKQTNIEGVDTYNTTIYINANTTSRLGIDIPDEIRQNINLVILHPKDNPEQIVSQVGAGQYYNIYLDSDRSNHLNSAQSIERGVKLALEESGNKLLGRKLHFILLDHAGNTVKAEQHLKQFNKDPNALVYYGGLHSPPLIYLREFINVNKILTLVPWAAGAPITRFPSRENYVFRLSVDDKYAGAVIANYALDKMSCHSPHLLLEESPWGESNLKNMTNALNSRGVDFKVSRFSWNLNEVAAFDLLSNIKKKSSDCILLVANVIESVKFANAMYSLDKADRLPIISHWGIAGGDFPRQVPFDKRKHLNISFIQSSFSFLDNKLDTFDKKILKRIVDKYPDINSAYDIEAPTGLIHAYDLTKILISASNTIKPSDNILAVRKRLKYALEHLTQPVEGLVKTYRSPFAEFSLAQPDSHEALGYKDYVMAKYGAKDEILLLK